MNKYYTCNNIICKYHIRYTISMSNNYKVEVLATF